VLNERKNRIDSASWIPAPIEAVLELPWPRGASRRERTVWSRAERMEVARSEGLPLSIEGYFVGARQQGPEATNCHGADGVFRDWHLWLAATPGHDRRHSVVVETTPSVRALHPEWSIAAIHRLVRDSVRVRVSGWLMLDQEHPEQLGKTRGTLWEIHPVMRIEVRQGSSWTVLGDTRR
jgi:hypothetical protein